MATAPMPGRADAAPPEDLSGVVPEKPDQPDTQGAGNAAPEAGRTEAVRMIRQLTTRIEALTQQFPEVAEAAKAANEALVKAAITLTGNSQDQGRTAAPPNR